MALAREDKERIVQEVKEVSASASSLVISDARGLKVSELTEIRKQGTESGVHIQVIKNSLAKLAFEGTDFGCTDEVLTGPSLFAFSYAEPGAAYEKAKSEGPVNTSSVQPKSVPSNANFAREFLIT